METVKKIKVKEKKGRWLFLAAELRVDRRGTSCRQVFIRTKPSWSQPRDTLTQQLAGLLSGPDNNRLGCWEAADTVWLTVIT